MPSKCYIIHNKNVDIWLYKRIYGLFVRVLELIMHINMIGLWLYLFKSNCMQNHLKSERWNFMVIKNLFKKMLKALAIMCYDTVVKSRITLRGIHSWLYKHRTDYINWFHDKWLCFKYYKLTSYIWTHFETPSCQSYYNHAKYPYVNVSYVKIYIRRIIWTKDF